jgi:hypothetical protein
MDGDDVMEATEAFSQEAYDRLTERQQELLGDRDEVDNLAILAACDGCVPDADVESLEQAIVWKFEQYWRLIRDEVARRTGLNRYDFDIVVSPSWEDCTTSAVIWKAGAWTKAIDGGWQDERVVLRLDYTKAWHLGFETLADLAADVDDQAGHLVRAIDHWRKRLGIAAN